MFKLLGQDASRRLLEGWFRMDRQGNARDVEMTAGQTPEGKVAPVQIRKVHDGYKVDLFDYPLAYTFATQDAGSVR